jgi:hypothetical protein
VSFIACDVHASYCEGNICMKYSTLIKELTRVRS